MAPNLFSVSSGFDPWAITLASRPAPIIETMSTRSDLPEPITGDVKACIGAALKLRRLTIVSIAETATALSASPTNGIPLANPATRQAPSPLLASWETPPLWEISFPLGRDTGRLRHHIPARRRSIHPCV